jgi:16S rRNA (adenine1518-N6/adenine1519-N6)-dimethyltransferase
MPTLGRRRAFGQHFLKDRSIATRIAQTAIEAAEKSGCATVFEIGPGKGAITEPILEFAHRSEVVKKIILCEKDRALAAEWTERSRDDQLLRVQDSDFLELDEREWLGQAPLIIASNLPYSAGTAIFIRLAKHPEQIKSMVLMFQSEVAARLRAEIGTKAWGSLSIWTQNRWDVTKLVTVPPGAFQPPPEVMSEVVTLVPREKPRVIIPVTEPMKVRKAEELWDSLLKTSFLHRRKMLRSGLPKSGPFRNALELSGVDGTKRAEALDWQEWEKLFHAFLRAHQLT